MNAEHRSMQEVHLGLTDQAEPELPLSTDGVLRYVWHNRFGDMLIEVQDGQVFVNGTRVEPALSSAAGSAAVERCG